MSNRSAEVSSMDDLIRVAGVLIVSSLFLLGLATLIQIVEQLVREPGTAGNRR